MHNFFRYRGTYCSQEVAIKVLIPDRVNAEMLKDFAQEVYIMRFVWLVIVGGCHYFLIILWWEKIQTVCAKMTLKKNSIHKYYYLGFFLACI